MIKLKQNNIENREQKNIKKKNKQFYNKYKQYTRLEISTAFVYYIAQFIY